MYFLLRDHLHFHPVQICKAYKRKTKSSLLAPLQSQALCKQGELIYHLSRFVRIGIQTAQSRLAIGEYRIIKQ